MGSTITEKIIAVHCGRDEVELANWSTPQSTW
jgi:hypothetical protein